MMGVKESRTSRFTEGTYISLVTAPTISKTHHAPAPFSSMGKVHGSRMEMDFGRPARREQGENQWGLPGWRACSPGKVNLQDFLKETAPSTTGPKHPGHGSEAQCSGLVWRGMHFKVTRVSRTAPSRRTQGLREESGNLRFSRPKWTVTGLQGLY